MSIRGLDQPLRDLAAVLDIAPGDIVRLDGLGLGLVDRLASPSRAVVHFASARFVVPLTDLEIIERSKR